MELNLGISPCPNDTFIFFALIEGKIDVHPYRFNFEFADVEELNHKAKDQQLDITKLSFHAYAYFSEFYQLLNSGSALGKGCGPLLISNENIELKDVKDKTIAIPGQMTTANLLLNFALPEAQDKKEMLFSEIEDSVLNGESDLGLIIHENRFTYQAKGLKKILDLGAYWEEETGLAIPLGGIAIRRNLPQQIKKDLDQLVGSSLEYAYQHKQEALEFARTHAQEMELSVIEQHIALYVNEFSKDLGYEGRQMIHFLYDYMQSYSYLKVVHQPIFV